MYLLLENFGVTNRKEAGFSIFIDGILAGFLLTIASKFS